jgi:pimeloyl-ACP methyl ester carboxylesterase
MANWEDGFVEANGIKVHYYRTGGDKPQVVLNHGAMDDGLCWTRVAKELEPDYDVIMIDARGHGLSDSGQGDYRSETRTADLAETIKMLGLDKPAIGGHSMGADVSFHLAAMYTQIPRAIFLEDPPLVMPGQPVFGGDIGKRGDSALKLMATIMYLFKIMPKFIGKPLAKKMMPVSPDDEIIPWLNSKKRTSTDFICNMRNVIDIEGIFPSDVLKKIKVPTLLIMGDRERGAIVSQEAAQELAAILPDLQIAHLQGANHDIRRAKFDEYIQSLKSFLAQTNMSTAGR